MYDPTWSDKEDLANEIMISNFIKILETESIRKLYTQDEIFSIINAVKEHTLAQASKVHIEQQKLNK